MLTRPDPEAPRPRRQDAKATSTSGCLYRRSHLFSGVMTVPTTPAWFVILTRTPVLARGVSLVGRFLARVARRNLLICIRGGVGCSITRSS